jgi:hypothetical protein
MYKALNLGAIGIQAATLDDAIEAAVSGLFHAVEISPEEIARLPAVDVLQKLETAKMKAAAWGLPASWRGSEGDHAELVTTLPTLAKKCFEVNCVRASTWISPASDSVSFEDNWNWHVGRLSPLASILADHGCRLGLEYVGPATSRKGKQHEFVWSWAERRSASRFMALVHGGRRHE